MRSLGPRTAHLYYLVDDDTPEAPLSAAARRICSDDELERLERLRIAGARRQFVLGRLLVRTLLSRHAPRAPQVWRFVLGPHGRPEIADPEDLPPLRFNLSHTPGFVVLGVTLGREIGVDVENTTREVGDARVAERFFAAPESRDVLSRTGAARRERFFAYWTLKEAYIKARGLGLALPLGRFWLDLDGPVIRISFAPEIEDDPAVWQFWRHSPGPGCAMAVALRRGADSDIPIELTRVDVSDLVGWGGTG